MALGKVYELADRLLEGTLEDRLREWRAGEDPVSYDRIARRLEDETGVHHSRETVRRWCQNLGIDSDADLDHDIDDTEPAA